MSFNLLKQQLAVGFDNQLHGFAQIFACFIYRLPLRICAWKFLNIAKPPIANFLKHSCKFHGNLQIRL